MSDLESAAVIDVHHLPAHDNGPFCEDADDGSRQLTF